ncbi:MAG: ABC transporter substrate-binding protein [Steroidobacteraceae bacterium]
MSVFFRTIFILTCCVATARVPALAQSDESVRSFVERLNEASLTLSASSSEWNARQKCQRLLAWAFDVQTMARSTLGEVWNKATVTQRNEFLKVFEEAVVTAYVRRVEANRGMTLAFVGTRPQSDGHQFAATHMIMPGKAEQIWIWRLRPVGGSWRVVDALTNGRSLLQAERQEYNRVLETSHGDIGAVIAFIRSRENR